MSRHTILALVLLASAAAPPSLVLATPSDKPARHPSQWRGTLCTNCQPEPEAASRVGAEVRIATKLVAPNTCADPGPVAWFAEEEDHVSAFLNSSIVRLK